MGSAGDRRTTAEIYQEAETANEQVTDGLKNALRIVDDTRDVQATTLEELKKQGDQLGEIQEDLDDVQEDTKYAQSVLDNIGCLCWCFAGKPKMQRPIHPSNLPISAVQGGMWLCPRPKYKPETKATTPKKPVDVQTMNRMPGTTQDGSKTKATDSAAVPATAEEEAQLRIEKGKQEQEQLLDQISNGLDVLAQGAKAMGEELARQEEVIDTADTRASEVVHDTRETVRHSAFRRHVREYM